MAVSYVGSQAAEANTVTIPTHQVGDIIVIFAFRDGSTTQPTLPSDFTSVATQAGTSCCGRAAVKIADTTSETSGTWTNATNLVCHVYRGSAGVGAVGVTAAASATFTYPTVALQKTDSTSWVAGFAGHRSTNGAVGTAPSGMTNRTNNAGATADAGSHDTNGGVSSWPTGRTAAYGGTSSGWVAITLEILEPNAKIETLTDTFASADGAKWNGYGANPSVASGRLQIQATAGYSSVSTPNYYSLQGSYVVFEMAQRPISTANCNVGLQDESGNNRIAFGWSSTDLKFVENANGTVTEPTLTYNSSTHRWCRFTESNGVVNWDTSSDGITWTNRRTKTWACSQIGRMYAFVDCGGVNDVTTPLLLDNWNLYPMSGTLAAANQKATASFTGDQSSSGMTGTLAALLQQATASLSGTQTQTGALAAANQKATASFTGTQIQTGTLAAANQKPTAALTGVMQPSSVLAAANQPATAALTGSQIQTGTLAGALQALLFSGTGTQTQTGTLAAASQKATASLTGVMVPSGTLAASTQRPTMSATGAQTQTGTLSASLQILAAAMVGTQTQSGTLAAAIQMATATLTGAQTQTGTLAAAVQKLVFTAAAQQTQLGALAAANQVPAASFAGLQTAIGVLAALIQPLEPELTGAVSGAPAAMFATIQPLTADLLGTMVPAGQLAAQLQALAFSAQGSQTVTGSFAGNVQKLTASLVGESPYTGSLSGVLSPLVFDSLGTQALDGVMAAALPAAIGSLVGVIPPEGVLAAVVSGLVAQLEGTGPEPDGVLAASIAPLVFASLAKVYKLALDRLTVVEVADRSAHVSLDPRSVTVDAGSRSNDVLVLPRITAATVDDRNTTVKREI